MVFDLSLNSSGGEGDLLRWLWRSSVDFGDDMDVGCALKTNVLCVLLSMYVSNTQNHEGSKQRIVISQ